MVSFEFEKPGTWTIGKKIGAAAIIVLLIGMVVSFSLCLPIITIGLIIFLLYMKFDIYLEKKNETRVKINHFILIIVGGLLFLSHLASAILFFSLSGMSELQEVSGIWGYMAIGMLVLAFGFLLCVISGILEWKYPTMAAPRIGLPKKAPTEGEGAKAEATGKKEKLEVVEEKPPETSLVPESRKAAASMEEGSKVKPEEKEKPEERKKEKEPSPAKPAKAVRGVKAKTEVITREPASEEEKTLMRWAKHINQFGQTFEQCLKCKDYVFMKAEDAGDEIVFSCPKCGENFNLKK